MADETISRLCETMNQQQQITALAALSVPEFSGLPGEDVEEFLRRFKVSTFALSDELKCIALRKALVNSARIWAKDNLRPFIEREDWKGAKKAIQERFQLDDHRERYREKLANMTYNPKLITLRSFVEGYASCYKKAHSKAKDKDVIEGLVQVLPNNIKHTLNLLSESWRQMADLDLLYPLIKRVEQTILPYLPQETEPSEKLNVSTMTKLLKQMQDEFKKDCLEKLKTESKATNDQTLAAIMHIPQRRKPMNLGYHSNNQNQLYPKNQPNYDRFKNNRRNWHQTGEQDNNRQKRPPLPAPMRQMLPSTEHRQKQHGPDVKNAYYQKHGRPPGPCHYCQQDHFNKHCPYINLN